MSLTLGARSIMQWMGDNILDTSVQSKYSTILVICLPMDSRSVSVIKTLLTESKNALLIWCAYKTPQQPQPVHINPVPENLVLAHINNVALQKLKLFFQCSAIPEFVCRVNTVMESMCYKDLTHHKKPIPNQDIPLLGMQLLTNVTTEPWTYPLSFSGIVVVFQSLRACAGGDAIRAYLHKIYRNGIHVNGQIFEYVYIQSPLCSIKLCHQPYRCSSPKYAVYNYRLRRCLGVSPLHEEIRVLGIPQPQTHTVREHILNSIPNNSPTTTQKSKYAQTTKLRIPRPNTHTTLQRPQTSTVDSIMVIYGNHITSPQSLRYTLFENNVINTVGSWVAHGCVIVLDILRGVDRPVAHNLLRSMLNLRQAAQQHNSDVVIMAGGLIDYRVDSDMTQLLVKHTVCVARLCNWVILDIESTNRLLDQLDGVYNGPLLRGDEHINQLYRLFLNQQLEPQTDLDIAMGIHSNALSSLEWVRLLKRMESTTFTNTAPYHYVFQKLGINTKYFGGICCVGTHDVLDVSMGLLRCVKMPITKKNSCSTNVLQCNIKTNAQTQSNKHKESESDQ